MLLLNMFIHFKNIDWNPCLECDREVYNQHSIFWKIGTIKNKVRLPKNSFCKLHVLACASLIEILLISLTWVLMSRLLYLFLNWIFFIRQFWLFDCIWNTTRGVFYCNASPASWLTATCQHRIALKRNFVIVLLDT